jgi:hypothetical protein
MYSINSKCPQCSSVIPGAFPQQCPYCSFNIDALAGKGTTDFQRIKWNKHTDLLQGRDIQLYGQKFNTSFDYSGSALLADIVRFAITMGDRAMVKAPRGTQQNQAIICYIPDRIGAGTAIYDHGTVACSGICLISPNSPDWGHSFPVLDDWVQQKFAGYKSSCKLCATETAFGQPICAQCYREIGENWKILL